MPPDRYPPDDPREWIARAKSNLAVAKSAMDNDSVFFEDLCFECQQAAEKSLKALLIKKSVNSPRTHDIAELLTLVQKAGFNPPDDVLKAATLTGYSVASRYPGPDEPVTEDEFREALAIAENTVAWACGFILS